MNISFHYFAIKTLALKAGFSEDYAQIIATFSQYIDDYNVYYYRRYDGIHDWVKHKPYDMYLPSKKHPFNFNPVTTGFWDIIDYAVMLTERYQTFTISPFHFIPQSKLKIEQNDYKTYHATLGDDSIISNELEKARKQYVDDKRSDEERELILMLIGCRLHTFADTYAHENFSGYFENCNKVNLKSVTNNLNVPKKDETRKYKSIIEEYIHKFEKILNGAGYEGIPFALGHMMLGHLPDYPWLTYTYSSYSNKDKIITRNNTEVFLAACKEIFIYLCSCLGEKVGRDEWAFIETKMKEAFSFDETEYETEKQLIEALMKHWSTTFRAEGYNYQYDRHKIFNGIVGPTYTRQEEVQSKEGEKELLSWPRMEDDFYIFNACSDQLLITLYGEEPRNKNI